MKYDLLALITQLTVDIKEGRVSQINPSALEIAQSRFVSRGSNASTARTLAYIAALISKSSGIPILSLVDIIDADSVMFDSSFLELISLVGEQKLLYAGPTDITRSLSRATAFYKPPRTSAFPPEILTESLPSATEFEAYEAFIETFDQDKSDTVSLRITNLPTWLYLTEVSKNLFRIAGTPGSATEGNYDLFVVATDDAGAFTQKTLALEVINVNEAPVFTSTPVLFATEDQPYTYNITTADPDLNDTRSVHIVDAPEWLTLTNLANGGATLSTTSVPGIVNATVHLRVIDAAGLSNDQIFVIDVIQVGHAPVFTTTPLTSIVSTNQYVYEYATADEDEGDTFVVTVESMPTWATITETDATQGTISGTPTEDDAGPHTVSLRVTDQGGLFTVQSFQILVTSSAAVESYQTRVYSDRPLYYYTFDNDHELSRAIMYDSMRSDVLHAGDLASTNRTYHTIRKNSGIGRNAISLGDSSELYLSGPGDMWEPNVTCEYWFRFEEGFFAGSLDLEYLPTYSVLSATDEQLIYLDHLTRTIEWVDPSNDTIRETIFTDIVEGTWYHYVQSTAVGAVDTVKTYTLNNTTVTLTHPRQSDGEFVQLFATYNYRYMFLGTVDEVAIYDRILTPEEISDHYTLGLTEIVWNDQPSEVIESTSGAQIGNCFSINAAGDVMVTDNIIDDSVIVFRKTSGLWNEVQVLPCASSSRTHPVITLDSTKILVSDSDSLRMWHLVDDIYVETQVLLIAEPAGSFAIRSAEFSRDGNWAFFTSAVASERAKIYKYNTGTNLFEFHQDIWPSQLTERNTGSVNIFSLVFYNIRCNSDSNVLAVTSGRLDPEAGVVPAVIYKLVDDMWTISSYIDPASFNDYAGQRESYLLHFATQESPYYNAKTLAFSGDGKTFAVGVFSDGTYGVTAAIPPAPIHEISSHILIFREIEDGNWVLCSRITSPNSNLSASPYEYGCAIYLSYDGTYLAATESYFDSSAFQSGNADVYKETLPNKWTLIDSLVDNVTLPVFAYIGDDVYIDELNNKFYYSSAYWQSHFSYYAAYSYFNDDGAVLYRDLVTTLPYKSTYIEDVLDLAKPIKDANGNHLYGAVNHWSFAGNANDSIIRPIAIPTVAVTEYDTYIASTNPIYYWNFDLTTTEVVSGTTILSGDYYSFEDVGISQSIRIGASYVTAPNGGYAVNSTTPFTIVAWVRPDLSTTYSAIFGDVTTYDGFQIYGTGNGSEFEVYFYSNTTSNAGGTFQADGWVHLAVVHDSGTLTFYANNIEIGSISGYDTPLQLIYAGNDGGEEAFVGIMDSVVFYDVADPSLIAGSYNSTKDIFDALNLLPYESIPMDLDIQDPVYNLPLAGNAHGTLEGLTSFIPGGISGGAIRFEESNESIVRLPRTITIDGRISITAWVRITDDQGYDKVILGDWNEFCFYITWQNSVAIKGSSWSLNAHPRQLIRGEWAHIGVVWEPINRLMYLFVNSELVASLSMYNTTTYQIPTSFNFTKIGDDSNYFLGDMCELTLHNESLSQLDMAKLYYAGREKLEELPITVPMQRRYRFFFNEPKSVKICPDNLVYIYEIENGNLPSGVTIENGFITWSGLPGFPGPDTAIEPIAVKVINGTSHRIFTSSIEIVDRSKYEFYNKFKNAWEFNTDIQPTQLDQHGVDHLVASADLVVAEDVESQTGYSATFDGPVKYFSAGGIVGPLSRRYKYDTINVDRNSDTSVISRFKKDPALVSGTILSFNYNDTTTNTLTSHAYGIKDGNTISSYIRTGDLVNEYVVPFTDNTWSLATSTFNYENGQHWISVNESGYIKDLASTYGKFRVSSYPKLYMRIGNIGNTVVNSNQFIGKLASVYTSNSHAFSEDEISLVQAGAVYADINPYLEVYPEIDIVKSYSNVANSIKRMSGKYKVYRSNTAGSIARLIANSPKSRWSGDHRRWYFEVRAKYPLALTASQVVSAGVMATPNYAGLDLSIDPALYLVARGPAVVRNGITIANANNTGLGTGSDIFGIGYDSLTCEVTIKTVNSQRIFAQMHTSNQSDEIYPYVTFTGNDILIDVNFGERPWVLDPGPSYVGWTK